MENSDDSDKSKDVSVKATHDEILSKIYEAENKSVGGFFDAIFGFFYRNSPENIFSTSQHYGKQVLLSNYEKWDQKYQTSVESPKHSSKRARSDAPDTDFEKEESDNCRKAAANPAVPTHTTNTATVSMRSQSNKKESVVTESKKGKGDEESKLSFDTTNGAVLDNYSWTQTIDDLEVRFAVKGFIQKANQVKVQITEQHLLVEVQQRENSTEFEILADGPLKSCVRLDGSVWLLSPKQHISILLEKESETWWDRLLYSEKPIDLKKINAERDFGSMPEEERLCIEKVIADHRREERAGQSSGQQKLESLLREAWDAEGSPFKGQPFDPSLVQVMHSSS